MCNSMKKFKKLAALAITIPTLLSSTNISFAMKSPVQSNVHAPQRQTIHIPLNQLYLDGQGSVLFNPNVPYDNTFGFITIPNDFTPTGTLNIFIVNSLRHDENGCIYNENGYFTYNNGQPVQLPLPQQQFEAIPSEQYYYNTVDNSPFEQENMETQNTLNPQEQLIRISLNQLSLYGQGNVLYNPTVPCDDTYDIITIQTALTATNIQDTYIVNSLRHDENGYIYNYNENECFTYANGQPVQLPLPQQQFEAIPSEQYYYNTVDNSPFEQEEIQEQNEQVEDNKSPKPPKSTQKTAKTRKHCKIDCILCNEKECARPNGKPHIHKKDDTKTQQYICTKCGRTFTRPLHNLYATFTQPIFTQPIFTQPNVKKPYTREDGKQMQQYIFKNCRTHFTEDCILCNEKGCAVRNGAPYTRDDGKRMQQFRCKRCQKTFTRPINKNAEEQAGIETQPN